MSKINLEEFKIVIKARPRSRSAIPAARALLASAPLVIEVTGKDPHEILKIVERLLKCLIINLKLDASAQVLT